MCIVIKFERVIKSDKILSLEKIQNIFPPSIFRSNFFPLFFSLSLESSFRNFFSRTNEGRFSKGGHAIFNWWKCEIFNGQVEETSLNS